MRPKRQARVRMELRHLPYSDPLSAWRRLRLRVSMPFMNSLLFRTVWLALVLGLFPAAECPAAETVFKAGAAKRDITPHEPLPMWGYGARHDQLSVGTLDPLQAAAVVIQA